MSTTGNRHQVTIEADPALPIIRITRDFDATPAQLMRAHTDPELFARWVGPDGMQTRIVDWDATTGGRWRYVAGRDGEEHGFHGCFHEVGEDTIVQTFTYEGVPDGVALERMEEERPRLVLLDLMMPEMDGFEFTERVRQDEELRSVPIVVVTSHDLSREERQRLNGYVETIVQKAGDSPDALLHRVRELLGGFNAERPMITRTGGERRALPA